MAFDAAQYCEARLEPPTFIWKGRRFVGRILSADEWVLLHAHRDEEQRRAAAAAGEGDLSDASVERTVRDALRSARGFARSCVTSWFPAPWYLRPLSWLWPGLFHPAWRAFSSMPSAAQVEAIKDFSESQRKANPESQPQGTKSR